MTGSETKRLSQNAARAESSALIPRPGLNMVRCGFMESEWFLIVTTLTISYQIPSLGWCDPCIRTKYQIWTSMHAFLTMTLLVPLPLLGIVNGWLMAIRREGRRSQHIAHLSHEKLLHYAILHHPAEEASILTNQDQSVHAVSWCHSSPFFTFFYIIDWYQNMLREHIFLWAFASSMRSTCWWLVFPTTNGLVGLVQQR